jgi:hypothetical protein
MGYSSRSVSFPGESLSSSPALLVAGVLGAGLLCAFLVILVSLVRRQAGPGSSRHALPDIPPLKYALLARLLEEGDFDFVRQQPGGSVAMTRRLREARREIVRDYLAELERDFGALHSAAIAMIAFAPEQQGTLALDLAKLRWEFSRNLFVTRFRLNLMQFGYRAFEPSPLVGSVTSMQAIVFRLSTAAANQNVL